MRRRRDTEKAHQIPHLPPTPRRLPRLPRLPWGYGGGMRRRRDAYGGGIRRRHIKFRTYPRPPDVCRVCLVCHGGTEEGCVGATPAPAPAHRRPPAQFPDAPPLFGAIQNRDISHRCHILTPSPGAHAGAGAGAGARPHNKFRTCPRPPDVCRVCRVCHGGIRGQIKI